MNHKKVFAFDRTNFVLLAVGVVVVILGMVLMSGASSDTEHFNPEIFSTMRIKIAPLVCLAGYLFMIYAVMRKPRDSKEDSEKEK
ncbi:MAG: DUF3098 domain-containing protein [Alloprevotella sp.]|nr:DUF3098 domain-containing protein [Alloprevotella sp.]